VIRSTYPMEEEVVFPVKVDGLCRLKDPGLSCGGYVWTSYYTSAVAYPAPVGTVGLLYKDIPKDSFHQGGKIGLFYTANSPSLEFGVTDAATDTGIDHFNGVLKPLLSGPIDPGMEFNQCTDYEGEGLINTQPDMECTSTFTDSANTVSSYWFTFLPIPRSTSAPVVLVTAPMVEYSNGIGNVGVNNDEVYFLGSNIIDPEKVCRFKGEEECGKALYVKTSDSYAAGVVIKDVPQHTVAFFSTDNGLAYYAGGVVHLYAIDPTVPTADFSIQQGASGRSALPASVRDTAEFLSEVTIPTELPDTPSYSYIFRFDPLPGPKTFVIVPGDTRVNLDINRERMYTISVRTTMA